MHTKIGKASKRDLDLADRSLAHASAGCFSPLTTTIHNRTARSPTPSLRCPGLPLSPDSWCA